MAKKVRPKEVLKEAELAEKAGNVRVASQLYHSLALALSKHGKWREAAPHIDKAIRLSEQSARLYILKAEVCAELKDVSGEALALRSFVRYATEKGKLREYVAFLEDQWAEKPELRCRFYTELLKVDRTSPFAFHGIARNSLELGDYARAKGVLLECLKLKEKQTETVLLLSESLRKSGSPKAVDFVERYAAGQMTLDQLVALLGDHANEPQRVKVPEVGNDKDLRGLISDLEKELGLQVDEDLDAVRPLVAEFRRRAEGVVQGDAQSRIDLALAFFEMGLYEDAADELKQIGTDSILYGQALGARARVSAAQGADLQALTLFQEVIRREPKNSELSKEAQYELVSLYSRMNDLDRASEIARTLEKLDPNYREIHQLALNVEERRRR